MPLDGETVGVGLPIGVWFSQPVADRAAVERRLQVTSSKPVTGAWHWFADNEVHYRPRSYWPSGSRVTLRARLAGADAGRGVWGVADRTIRFRIGERRVSVVDVRTHRMKVVSGGRTLRVLPVSTGRERYPTTNGVHFVLEKTPVKLMDSSTVGIPRNSPGGYYQRVAWSVRISNSGEFVHAAPWSTGSQGRANVSHGCVNLSTANAAWFYRLTRRGDVVEVRGSPKRPGASFGVADWNMSWPPLARRQRPPALTAAGRVRSCGAGSGRRPCGSRPGPRRTWPTRRSPRSATGCRSAEGRLRADLAVEQVVHDRGVLAQGGRQPDGVADGLVGPLHRLGALGRGGGGGGALVAVAPATAEARSGPGSPRPPMAMPPPRDTAMSRRVTSSHGQATRRRPSRSRVWPPLSWRRTSRSDT